MKKDYKISIIIPVYNVEDYLSECVDSILNQTYENYEVLLIDDGSTDKSPQICDTYSEKNNISVINTRNRGLSAARNLGTEKAQGEYIFYLDSDDYVENNVLERMLKIVEQDNADIVCGNFMYTYPDRTVIAIKEEKEYEVLDTYSAMEQLVKGEKIQNFAWGKLIKKEIAQDHKFPVGKLFEDMYWTHYIIDQAGKVAIDYKSFVYYRQRDNSISYSFNIKSLDQLDGMIQRKEFIEEKYPDLLIGYLNVIKKNAKNLSWCVVRNLKKEQKKQGILRLRKFYNLINKNTNEDIEIKLFNKNITIYLAFKMIDRIIQKVKG